MTTLTPHIGRFLSSQRQLGRYNSVSVAAVRYRLAGLDRHFGNRPLGQFGHRSIEGWLENLGEVSPATRRSYLASARQFCRWLVEHGHLATDPTAAIPTPRQPRAVPRALPVTDVADALEACHDDRDRRICWLMVGLALRRGEVARLMWEDYDDRRRVMLVCGKGGHKREVGVPANVAAVLASARRTRGPIVESYRTPGAPLTPQAIGIRMSRLLYRAQVKRAPWDGVSGHAFRHTAASDVLDHCGDLRVVQAMLGHQNLSSTAIYLRRANLPQMREAMEGRDYLR